jgi:hypothetical protein
MNGCARPLVPEWLTFIFGIFEFIVGQCLVNMIIQAAKVWTLQMVPTKQNGGFLKNRSYNFDLILVIYGDRIPEGNYRDDTFRKILIHALEALTGSTDFI